ncbi:hypothetical protein QBC36DRAFT_287585 [Triangularia setosa]|uniref:Uncharacterized protein n=1 Tax=Triangularia setosa TaxID=2587417 RepID=A0AAN7AAT6_9PEZI|nr:hypothetical protein QBC36DRAFT_287585 [Podospora setosa]
MDQASRGPLGSAKLALRIRHKHFVTPSTILSIVSVLTSPVTQLAISYPLREVVGPEDALGLALRSPNHLTDDPGDLPPGIHISSFTISSLFRYGFAYNVTGKALREESYINITWGWISFLAAELVLATVFPLLTIFTQIKDRKRHAENDTAAPMFHNCKDSTLVPLLALSNECRAAVGGGLHPREEMEKIARGLFVKFQGKEVVAAGVGKEEV